MTNTKELTKKQPSKKLREAIHDMIGSFQKTAISIDRVFLIGRDDGFSDMEIGNMIRKAMLAANYDPRTIRRALPSSAKHIERVRGQKAFADKMSANEHENKVRTRFVQESDSDVSVKNTIISQDSQLAPNVQDLPTRESDQKPAWKVSVAKQSSNQLTEEQTQQTIPAIEEDSIIFGSARISTSPRDSELLEFEIPIPKDTFLQYVEDIFVEGHRNKFWINIVVNQKTHKILSVYMGKE